MLVHISWQYQYFLRYFRLNILVGELAYIAIPSTLPQSTSLFLLLWNQCMCLMLWLLTWVEAVAGGLGSLKSFGQLVGEEDVAQLAVAVELENIHG